MISEHTEQANATSADYTRPKVSSKRNKGNSALPDGKTQAHEAHSNRGKKSGIAAATAGVDQLVADLQHAYLQLVKGDSADARQTLEQALTDHDAGEVGAEAHKAAPVKRGKARKLVRSLAEPGAARVTIRTLGRFEIVVDGIHPGSPRKPAYRPLGLLKVLVAQGGCAVSEGVVVDALWPDLDGDHAHDARQVALHRLRKLLGFSEAISVSDGRMFIDDDQVWVDAFALETVCRNSYLGGNLERAQIALELYKGPFLPSEIDAHWSIQMRECLRAKFVNLIARAATELESQADYAAAASMFERGLAVDDLENVLRAGLVRCLKQSGAGRVSRTRT